MCLHMCGWKKHLIFHLFCPLLSRGVFIASVIRILIQFSPSDFLLAHWFMSVHGQTPWRASSRECEGKSQKEHTFKANAVAVTLQKMSCQLFHRNWLLAKGKIGHMNCIFKYLFSLKIITNSSIWIFEHSHNGTSEVCKIDSELKYIRECC